ncbi:pancreatic triacylglycerol lipase-like [Battus philenor]|uniref:pancreatic triacylglycerol lipase-like n=1 Tax=Battus philenor TaxID=42288 RepID=UPI0035D11C47
MQAFIMKHFITYLFCLHSCSVVFADTDDLNSNNGTADQRFMQMTDGKGISQDTDDFAEGIAKFLYDDINQYTNVYLLYTRKNIQSYEMIKYNDAQSITRSSFNASNPTVVIVHGWISDRNSDINIVLRNAFIMKADYNVIVVDWSKVSMEDYITAAERVPRIGQYLGDFLTFFCDATGVPLRSLHLIGHSLGAHVVGNAGKKLGGQVGRITGLDPAGPLWNKNSNRLSKTDAHYVEAIHTNAGVFGIASSVGTVDFYPNGGVSQPGCLTDECNHDRSWNLFAATVLFDHLVGHKCSTVLQYTLNQCYGDALKLGNDELTKNG